MPRRAKAVPDLDEVRALAEEVRAFLEPHWAAFRERGRQSGDLRPDAPEPDAPSTGMCRLSSRFLLRRLDEAFPEGEWEVRGGACTPGEDTAGRWGGHPAGMRDTEGNWNGHYWLEAHDGTVVDVTGDQFGWEPVVVSRSAALSCYRHNYASWALEEHMRRARWTAAEWGDAWDARHAPGAPSP